MALPYTVNFKKLIDNAHIPTYGDSGAAGLDLYAAIDRDVIIPVGDTIIIDTGIAIEIPAGYFGGVYARSGLGIKEGLIPSNAVGVIDSTYRDSIKVALYNHSREPRIIKPQQRIAQLVIQPYLAVDLKEVNELSTTERGTGGLGSTGKF